MVWRFAIVSLGLDGSGSIRIIQLALSSKQAGEEQADVLGEHGDDALVVEFEVDAIVGESQ